MSEQWGTITTEGITFEEFCRTLLSIPSAQACASPDDLARMFEDVSVVQNPSQPERMDVEAHGWAYDSPENILDAFKAISGKHPHAHVRAYHCDTRGYEIDRTYTHTPEPRRDDTTFGDLRSALAHGPSEDTFTKICDLLGSTQPDPRLLDYVRAHIATWPRDIQRSAPLSWLWRHVQWNTCPQIGFCNLVDVPAAHGAPDNTLIGHFSIRIVGLDAPDVYMKLFDPEANSFDSLDDFVQEHEGTRIHSPRPGEAIITYTHRSAYCLGWHLQWVQRTFPEHLIHAYVCNDYNDYGYMTLHEGPDLLYLEDICSPLPLEARVSDGLGGELGLVIGDDPDASTMKRLDTILARVRELGGDPEDLMNLSRVPSWFDGQPPDPNASADPRDQSILECIRTTHPPRYVPASRDELVDPMNDDDIPF